MNRDFKLNSDSRYNLRQISQFSRTLVRYHGTESISYLGPKSWDTLPDNYKIIENLDTVKVKLVSAIFYQFFSFLPNDSPFKNYERCFLFDLKNSFTSRYIQIFLIFSFPFHTFQI